jgi:signal transduction histidine kinase
MKEHLKEKDRQKDEFINIASHELRTPIQPIVSYIELAKKGVVSQGNAFEVILTEAKRLKRLADDILDVSRIEGKRLNLKKESFSINEVLAKLVEETRPSLKNDAVFMTFQSNVSSDSSDRVHCDKYRIVQVMINIVNNAVKFTKKGSIEIRTESLDDGSAIEIIVADTGGGIPDEIFPKLFEKFATKGVQEGTQNGTGLGLFISKAIVEAHNGSIVGLNNDRGGATFKVILPTEKVSNKENSHGNSEQMAIGTQTSDENNKISAKAIPRLCVEKPGEESMQKACSLQLEKIGATTTARVAEI